MKLIETRKNQQIMSFYYQILVGQSEQRTLPTRNDIENCLYTDFEIKPYIIKHNDVIESCLTEVAAISLINMYCGTLLKSKFACLVPIWNLYEKNDSEDSEKLFRVLNIFFII